MWMSIGIALSFIYQVYKKWVIATLAGASGVFGVAVFSGMTFPGIGNMLPDLSVWLSRVGSGGLALPIGMLVGEKLADRFREATTVVKSKK